MSHDISLLLWVDFCPLALKRKKEKERKRYVEAITPQYLRMGLGVERGQLRI